MAIKKVELKDEQAEKGFLLVLPTKEGKKNLTFVVKNKAKDLTEILRLSKKMEGLDQKPIEDQVKAMQSLGDFFEPAKEDGSSLSDIIANCTIENLTIILNAATECLGVKTNVDAS